MLNETNEVGYGNTNVNAKAIEVRFLIEVKGIFL
jgi:hypothetical protein